MKEPLDRTKVVLRHLPPAISKATLIEQIDGAFSGRYDWVSFHPGKTSQRNRTFSRAYIDFKRPEDVLQFAEYFNGHVFVNEKGTQFKTIVEYAPSQRVPKHWLKKDGREGTIFEDPEYLEFLEILAKPVENLPSAEIQLERRELERAGAMKENPIITPLMDFVRQKRAAKAGSGRLGSNGKSIGRAGASSGRSISSSSKRRSEKRRVSTMYVTRDTIRNTSSKESPTYILVAKRDDQLSNKTVTLASTDGTDSLEEDLGFSGVADGRTKKLLLLKGKGKEISQMSVTPSVKSIRGSPASRSKLQREGSDRVTRSIISNKDVRQSQSSGDKSEQPMQASDLGVRRPPRPTRAQLVPKDANGSAEDRALGNELHSYRAEKLEKRTRSRDRSDRVPWALRRSEESYANDESFSSSASQSSKTKLDTARGHYGDVKADLSHARNGDMKILGSGHSYSYSMENGSYKYVGRRGQAQNVKDSDGPSFINEGRQGKRGVASGYGSQEKQVWVQKSSSGS